MARFSGTAPDREFRWGPKLAFGGLVVSLFVLIPMMNPQCGS
jgi:hypothetical protein